MDYNRFTYELQARNFPVSKSRRSPAPHQSPATHQPPPQVGRGTYRLPTGSAHADGGAAKVKKALFFGGSTPFLWASTKEMGSKGRTGQRPPPSVTAHTYKAKTRKGGTPGEGSPLDPLLRFNKHQESSALCGARAGAPPLHPAAFEKAGETFIRASRSVGQKHPGAEAPGCFFNRRCS